MNKFELANGSRNISFGKEAVIEETKKRGNHHSESSAYNTDSSVTVNYLIASNLHDTAALLKQWNSTFGYFLNETKRQIDEDVPHFSESQLRTWRGNKQVEFLKFLIDLEQNIEIISNSNNIKKLYQRVQSLENDLKDSRNLVDDLKESGTCSKKTKKIESATGGVNFFSGIAKKFPQVQFIAKSAEVVPVVGGILKGVTVLTSAFCYIILIKIIRTKFVWIAQNVIQRTKYRKFWLICVIHILLNYPNYSYTFMEINYLIFKLSSKCDVSCQMHVRSHKLK